MGHGSTLQIETNRTTEVSYAYPPFGSAGAPSATALNVYRYTGQEASDNAGLYYYRGRYYSPTFSRFISEDPLELNAGPNLYAYANNDPINHQDPLGLYPGAGAAGLVAGAMGGAQCGSGAGGGDGSSPNGNVVQVSWARRHCSGR